MHGFSMVFGRDFKEQTNQTIMAIVTLRLVLWYPLVLMRLDSALCEAKCPHIQTVLGHQLHSNADNDIIYGLESIDSHFIVQTRIND